eukprot:Clim_evm12s143 gene=Clim_evmTU12s143
MNSEDFHTLLRTCADLLISHTIPTDAHRSIIGVLASVMDVQEWNRRAIEIEKPLAQISPATWDVGKRAVTTWGVGAKGKGRNSSKQPRTREGSKSGSAAQSAQSNGKHSNSANTTSAEEDTGYNPIYADGAVDKRGRKSMLSVDMRKVVDRVIAANPDMPPSKVMELFDAVAPPGSDMHPGVKYLRRYIYNVKAKVRVKEKNKALVKQIGTKPEQTTTTRTGRSGARNTASGDSNREAMDADHNGNNNTNNHNMITAAAIVADVGTVNFNSENATVPIKARSKFREEHIVALTRIVSSNPDMKPSAVISVFSTMFPPESTPDYPDPTKLYRFITNYKQKLKREGVVPA